MPEFYRKASIIHEFMSQHERWFTSWTYVTSDFFSFCENLNTSLNPYKQEERLKAISLLTLHIPWLTRTEFLLTISTQYQLDNWSIILQTNITKTVWQTVRGITNEIFDQALMFGFHPMALFWEKSNIKRIVWLTVRRIKNLIWELRVKFVTYNVLFKVHVTHQFSKICVWNWIKTTCLFCIPSRENCGKGLSRCKDHNWFDRQAITH